MDAERIINEQPLSNLPERVKGNHCKKWKMNDIQTNYYYVTLAAIERIFVYSVKFNPSLPADNTKQRLELLKAASQISDNIVNPVLTSSNIFSLAPPKQDLFEVPSGNFRITIKKVKVIEPKNNEQVMLNFLNIALRNVMKKLNFTELGKSRKFFNTIKF